MAEEEQAAAAVEVAAEVETPTETTPEEAPAADAAPEQVALPRLMARWGHRPWAWLGMQEHGEPALSLPFTGIRGSPARWLLTAALS
jgi:hypothetical protein